MIEENYGNRIRIRVCGIGLHENNILMVRHSGIGEKNNLWLPPGGGMEYGENALLALERKIQEETNIECKVKEFMFIHEFFKKPFHAVELFFRIEFDHPSLTKGYDPEHEVQIIEEVKFMSEHELYSLDPQETHNVFAICKNFEELLNLKGYVLFPE